MIRDAVYIFDRFVWILALQMQGLLLQDSSQVELLRMYTCELCIPSSDLHLVYFPGFWGNVGVNTTPILTGHLIQIGSLIKFPESGLGHAH